MWLSSTPTCAETNNVMQELRGVKFNHRYKNKDMPKARHTRDMKHTVTILSALATRNLFSLDTDNNLGNIKNNVIADSNVMTETTKSVGN